MLLPDSMIAAESDAAQRDICAPVSEPYFVVFRPYKQHGTIPESRLVDTVLTTALSSPATDKAEAISTERFDEIMRQHQRRVYRVIFLLVRDADTADTLTQECFLRAYQKRASFRGECRHRDLDPAHRRQSGARP